MTEYLVKISFWLPAYVDVTIEADNDRDAIEKAKTCAAAELESCAYPDHIDTSERHAGAIAYIDRITGTDRCPVAEWISINTEEPPGMPPAC